MAQNPKMAHLESTSPATGAVAITGSAQSLDVTGRALLVTGTGNITFTMQDGASITWANIPVGIYPLTVKSIANGATATGYVLL